MTWTVAGLAILNAVLAPIVFFVLFPKYQQSLLRYQLWQLRDRLWDVTYKHGLRDEDHAAHLLKRIEDAIRSTNTLTFREAVPLLLALRRTSPSMARQTYLDVKEEINEGRSRQCPELIREIERHFEKIVTRYAARVSFFGLLVWVAVFIRSMLLAVRTELSGKRPLRSRREKAAPAVQVGVTAIVTALDRRDPIDHELTHCLG